MEKRNIKLDTDELIATFGLKRNLGCSELNELLQHNITENDEIFAKLEEHRMALSIEGDFWNEEELKMQFLAFLFFYAKINEPEKIKIFYERPLSGKIEGKTLNVKCDCFFAKPIGVNKPAAPYFFLQKFKKKKTSDDAEAQMLAAMLLAQQMNNDEKPVYGAFLQGRNWIFATLLEKKYCVSEQFDATKKDDLITIVNFLKNLKNNIVRHYA